MNTKMSYAEYDALPGVRASDLLRMRKSPLHYRNKPDDADTPNRGMLRAIHSRVLEPEKFESEYALYDGVRRGREFESFVSKHQGMTILNRREWETSSDVASHVLRHPVAGPLFTGKGESELTLQWRCEGTNLPCKARIDRFVYDTKANHPIIVELKSYGSTIENVVANNIVRFGAHIQLAHYMEVVMHATDQPIYPRLMIVSCETSSPFDVAVFELADDSVDLGMKVREQLMDRLAQCLRENKWPGRHEEIKALSLPGWAWSEDRDANIHDAPLPAGEETVAVDYIFG